MVSLIYTCSLEGSGSKRDSSSSSDTDSFWTTEDNLDNIAGASRQNGAVDDGAQKSASGSGNEMGTVALVV